jgi:hypothetical protein
MAWSSSLPCTNTRSGDTLRGGFPAGRAQPGYKTPAEALNEHLLTL